MKYIIALGLFVGMMSCGGDDLNDNNAKTNDPIVAADTLVKVVGDKFTEYYPGGKQIKFQGTQDEGKKRHGKWLYYALDGNELSMTMYDHGLKHGHTVVKHPNGALYYLGEYHYDKKIGIWKIYDETGKLISETDYKQVEN